MNRKRSGKKRRGMSIVKGLFLWTFLLGASFVVGMFVISPLFYAFGGSKKATSTPAPAVTAPTQAQTAQQTSSPAPMTSPPPQPNVSSTSNNQPLDLSVTPADNSPTASSASTAPRREVQSPASLDTRASRRWQDRSQPIVHHRRRYIRHVRHVRSHKPTTLKLAPPTSPANPQGNGTENQPVQPGTGF